MSDSTKFCTVLEREKINDEIEIVLCDRGEEFTTGRFVTWKRSLKDGATYWGSYWEKLYDASNNFVNRVAGERS